ncbi:ABC transporter permease [Orrella daihaiensis]|uniref:ABC transporter permease n=1 Tax=Orrella daihaiensis TaxID=2782176 RepID=A0ABY4AL74_9BURK|nr:ABC transporter permease [Orrella daihaiensis]UOD51060.1 ABC transporter permease [Orrella daihaiensis]
MIRLEPRPAPSATMRVATPVVAIVLTILTGLLIFALLGKDPVRGFAVFFVNPLKTTYGISEWLLKATPLALCAAGLAVGFRASVWNIGAEGQFMLGAIGATLVALYAGSMPVVTLVLMILAGIAAGALWAAIPAFLRTHFNASEILVSLMLVYVAELLVSWLVFGPLRDPMGFNFPQTVMFEPAALLPILVPGTRLNLVLGFVVLVLLATYVLVFKTHLGFKMRVAGESPNAARYAGISAKTMVWLGLLIGGACAGLAGMAEVAGPMGQLTDKVGSGYGFAAIIVAFVGRLHPLGIALASLLMALFFIGGEQSQQYLGLPGSISMVFQGLLLFYLLATDVLIGYRLRLGRDAHVTNAVKAKAG